MANHVALSFGLIISDCMESWVFNKKEIRFIADLITAGGKVGFPYNISRVFRSKKNLLITFMNPDNSVTIKNGDSSYRLLKKYEIRQYQYTDYPSGKQIKYEEKRALHLIILPAGCSTGKVFHKEGNICFYVLKGKCLYNDLYWDYCAIYPKRKEKWNEKKSQYELRINKSAFSRKNRLLLPSKHL